MMKNEAPRPRPWSQLMTLLRSKTFVWELRRVHPPIISWRNPTKPHCSFHRLSWACPWFPAKADEKGSVLIVVLGFVLAFSLLGVGSIHHSYTQSDIAEKEKASAEAFWMADGAIEMASHQLTLPTPVLIAETDPVVYTPIGRGSYSVYSEPVVAGSTDNWKINAHAMVNVPYSDGTVNDQFRGIEVKFGSYNIENAFTTHGTVNGGCSPAGSATIAGNCIPHDMFTFETIFNGMSQADFEVLATANTAFSPTYPNQNFMLAGPSVNWGISGITVIHPDFHNPTFNTDDSAEYDGNPAFLIVDMTSYTGGQTPKLNIAGNANFCGIIWTVGEIKIEGTANVVGAIFVDGSPTGDVPFTGNADLEFNLPCIAGAINDFGGTGLASAYVWKEYTL